MLTLKTISVSSPGCTAADVAHNSNIFPVLLGTKQTQLRKLESSSSSVAVFGQQMERLVEKLSQPSVQNRFSATPRGPLGALVTVRDANYIDIVQYVLRNVMSDFVVNSQEDARLLNGYIKHCFTGNSRPPSVHVIRFRDVSRLNRKL